MRCHGGSSIDLFFFGSGRETFIEFEVRLAISDVFALELVDFVGDSLKLSSGLCDGTMHLLVTLKLSKQTNTHQSNPSKKQTKLINLRQMMKNHSESKLYSFKFFLQLRLELIQVFQLLHRVINVS